MCENKSTENNLKTAFPSRLSTFIFPNACENTHALGRTLIFSTGHQSGACFLFLLNVLGFFPDFLELFLVNTTTVNFFEFNFKTTFNQHIDLKFS
jgi:hypothetical protein